MDQSQHLPFSQHLNVTCCGEAQHVYSWRASGLIFYPNYTTESEQVSEKNETIGRVDNMSC
ncbi:hypothetical protein WMZ97_06255 [Lentibacillus sp. N15]